MSTLIGIGICAYPNRLLSAPAQTDLSTAEISKIKKMSLRSKIGQLFIIGFQGKKITDGLGDSLRDIAPGGILVFGRNLESAVQVSKLITDAQAISYQSSSLPLLVATDQEGGDVIRIKTAMPLPSALALGEAHRTDVTEAAGFATGKLLKTLGFNMNLAPVLDIDDPNQQGFIGTRTYGPDPMLAGKMGVSFSAGLIKSGVLPTGKHFPGHGGVVQDSHLVTPEKNVSKDDLKKGDLIPFSAMQDHLSNDWAVMLAHVAFPQLDSSRTPATFSKPIVTDLLRSEMGFKGLIITDDIEMGGATHIRDPRERVIRAIEAGVDMVVVAWNKKLQRQLANALEMAVRKGRIPVSRIDASLQRILLAKKKFAGKRLVPTPSDIQAALNNPTFLKVAAATIQAQFDRADKSALEQFKAWASDRPLIVFSAVERFANSFKAALPSRAVSFVKVGGQGHIDIGDSLRKSPEAAGVFYVSGQQVGKMAQKIPPDLAQRILLVTVEAAGQVAPEARFRETAAVYYRHPDLGKFVAEKYFNMAPNTIRAPTSLGEVDGLKSK